MLIPVSEIKVNPEREKANPEHVGELAKSMDVIGLLNPITVDGDRNLIAGLHRLEAAKLLSWTEVECHVVSFDELETELAIIDENFIRRSLSTIQRGAFLLRRKELYEALHPETQQGMRNGQTAKNDKVCKNDKMSFLEPKPFAQDTAEKLHVSRRTVERDIQTAKKLSPEATLILQDAGTEVSKREAASLSRLTPEQQIEAATLRVNGQINSIMEYSPRTEDKNDAESEQKRPSLTAPAPALPIPAAVPSVTEDNATDGEPDVYDAFDSLSQTPESDDELSLPFKWEGDCHASFEESIANLKDTEKDFSITPDIYLTQIAMFVRKFHKALAWYCGSEYNDVYPRLNERQFIYLRRQMESIQAAAELFTDKMEGMIKK